MIVLGAYYQEIAHHLQEYAIKSSEIIIVENKDWQQGMSTSIKVGLKTLISTNPAIDSALFLLSDQPLLTSTHVLKLLPHTPSNIPDSISICASFYNDCLGVPAWFDKKWFPELMQLTADQGARKLLVSQEAEVLPIPFPEGAFDIDTPENYELLKRNYIYPL